MHQIVHLSMGQCGNPNGVNIWEVVSVLQPFPILASFLESVASSTLDWPVRGNRPGAKSGKLPLMSTATTSTRILPPSSISFSEYVKPSNTQHSIGQRGNQIGAKS
ncbi:hypothetical protein C8R42DRAFT_641979 [Lentinula raphanica]|nr:hypothetical protein C8R42DRAFT_641979 [Lentinula raphanica]